MQSDAALPANSKLAAASGCGRGRQPYNAPHGMPESLVELLQPAVCDRCAAAHTELDVYCLLRACCCRAVAAAVRWVCWLVGCIVRPSGSRAAFPESVLLILHGLPA